MFKIGDFSKLSCVSVKTLRYYDELGLLKPAHVDHFTGYRYYSADQLPRLNRILALKDLGFSLEQTLRLLEGALVPAQMRDILRMKQAELHQHVQDEQARLVRVEAGLRLIEQEDTMPEYDVVLKRIEAKSVASARKVAPTFGEISAFVREVHTALEQHGLTPIAPSLNIYHHMGFLDRDMEIEVAVPIDTASTIDIAMPSGERITSQVLPAVQVMACLTRQITDETISSAYNTMGMWIQSNGYRIVGPSREICQPLDQSHAAGAFLIEIQFPVELEKRLEVAKAVLAPHDLTRLTERSRQALQFAREETRALEHSAISAAHLFVGLMRENNSFAAHVLSDLGVTPDQVRGAATALGSSDTMMQHEVSLDEGSRRVFARAAQEAKQHGHDYIGTEHILLALMHAADPLIGVALQRANISPDQVSAHVEEVLNAQANAPDYYSMASDARQRTPT
jgi:DNA-binding transcriptional MerR regulator